MTLISRLTNHLKAYQQKLDNDKALLGLGRWAYTFPQKEFESGTCELAKEISASVKELENPELINSELVEKVRTLFFEVIPTTCSKETRTDLYQLLSENKTLQNILDEDVAAYRRAKVDDTTLVSDKDHQLERRIAKAKLAFKLGFRGELAGTGMGGATFLYGVNQKRLGVFKVTKEHQSHWKNFHDGPLSYVMHNQAYYVSSKKEAAVQAEEAAYLVSSRAGFGDLVPPTKVVDLGGVTGSFQLVADKTTGEEVIEFSGIVESFESRDTYTAEEIQMFQFFAVFDYLINNLDRHDRNWLVEYSKEGGEVRLHKIHAIDHDRAFVHTTPSSRRGLRSHYRWKKLKIAKEPMTVETKDFISANLGQEQLLGVLTTVMQSIEGFMSPEMVEKMSEKVAILQKMVTLDDVSLEDLGNIRTDDEIKGFLGT